MRVALVQLEGLGALVAAAGEFILYNYSNDVSCEFDEFRVDTHLFV